MGLQNIVQTILALIVIIWFANWVLGKLNTYMQGQNRSIQVIERFSITKNSSLAIVKVVNAYYLMSFSEGKNEILREFTAEEVYEIVEKKETQNIHDPVQLLSSFEFSKWKEKYTEFFSQNHNE